MKNFRIKFCWTTPLPIMIIYKNKEMILTETKTIVRAKTQSDVIKNLKGTKSDVISNINNIVEC